MLNDPIASMLEKINSYEKAGKKKCTFRPFSALGREVLTILKENNYIGDFTEIENKRGKFVEINLLGNINECRAVKPRFPISIEDYEKYEKRFLPAQDFGILIISTNKGLKTHTEAKKQKLGGRIIAYCY
jgi:small subunit ribosomal protein S8